jgi:hypothetical protein
VLLVILGAGASFDSVGYGYWAKRGGIFASYRPPRARELFEHRPDSFGPWVAKYPQSAALIAELRRRARSENVELILREIQEQAEQYQDPELFGSLLAVRYYLQGVLYDCGEEWPKASNGVTNYVELVGYLSRWRHRNDQRIAYATFNYDTLLDRALGRYPGQSLDLYVNGSAVRLFKVHGSISWGRVVVDEPNNYASGGGMGRQMVDKAMEIRISDTFVPFAHPNADVIDGKPLVPALAIPMTGKDSFEMPADHLVRLREWLPDVDRVLVIGWQGQDPNLLDLLKETISHHLDVVVASSVDGCEKTETALRSTGLGMSVLRVTGGFTELVENLAILKPMLGGV